MCLGILPSRITISNPIDIMHLYQWETCKNKYNKWVFHQLWGDDECTYSSKQQAQIYTYIYTYSNVRQTVVQWPLHSNGYASPFITYRVSKCKSVKTYTILKINIDILPTLQVNTSWVPATWPSCSLFSASEITEIDTIYCESWY